MHVVPKPCSPVSSPEWFVTDGREVVGPLPTQKLLRGVAQGIVRDEHSIWQQAWSGWRPLSAVREVGTLRAVQQERGAGWIPSPAWSPKVAEGAKLSRALFGFSRALDVGEVAVLALQAAALATGASVGLVHRPRKLMGGLEARGAYGASAWSLLGTKISATDPAMVAARYGARLIRLPARTRVGQASLGRLSGVRAPLRGVVLAPIYAQNRLAAILELGHATHAFRHADLQVIRDVTRAASAQIASR